MKKTRTVRCIKAEFRPDFGPTCLVPFVKRERAYTKSICIQVKELSRCPVTHYAHLSIHQHLSIKVVH
ncbi:Uncharacterized protein APZ42_019091 [Daphnia magna]|uniref:Uncharacterized protein n=1 Tax=Daphnia magna TaxID=35525 RepID=A0A164YM71_9CRUS|nr:Uncharacterized protein APZ42_019091 [Daphnia magna]